MKRDRRTRPWPQCPIGRARDRPSPTRPRRSRGPPERDRLVARGRRRRVRPSAPRAGRRGRSRPRSSSTRPGTTGRPEGHGAHAGRLRHQERARLRRTCMDVGEGDRLFWLTDLGWLMGPMLITARALPRARPPCCSRARPDYPEPDRLWQLLARAPRHVTRASRRPRCARSCRTAPSWIARPRSLVAPHHRLDGRAVEPRALSLALRARRARARADHQLHRRHRDLRRHPRRAFPIAPIKPCSFTGPIPGMAADVLRRRRRARARAGRRAGRHARRGPA